MQHTYPPDSTGPTSQKDETVQQQTAPRRPNTFGRVRDRGFAWIGQRFMLIAGKCGQHLNHRTRHWTRREQKLFLVFFVLGTQIVSFAALLYSLKYPPADSKVQQINMGTPAMPPLLVRPRLSTEDSMALRSFRLRLDSLMATPSGRDSVAAFNMRRPGFIDSLLRLESQLQP